MAGAIKRTNDNGGARHELDKFYTKDEHAATAINSIRDLLEQSDLIVEPSAGAGAFSRQIKHPNLQAYDLEPEHDDIICQDWFQTTRELIGEGTLTVIGNPPFGVRTDLAKKFITQAINLDTETIAFILPRTFSKALNQRTTLIPDTYRLVLEEDIPDEGFTLHGDSFHIPCRWYVWTRNTTFLPDVNLRKSLLPDHPDFTFLKREHPEADFTLNGNSGKVKGLEQVTNPKAEHYIQVTDRNQVETIRDHLSNLTFTFNSSVNGGVAWIGKQEILAAYTSQHPSSSTSPVRDKA